MSEARSIGDGWFEYVDPGAGKKFYANATTQEPRWNWPDEIPSTAEAKFEPSPMAHPTTVIGEKKMDTSDLDQWEYGTAVELGDELAGVFATTRASAVAVLRNHGIVLDQYLNVDSTGTLMIGELKYRVGTGSPTNPHSDTLCFKDAAKQKGEMATWRRDVRVDISKWRTQKTDTIKFFGLNSIILVVLGIVLYLQNDDDNMMVLFGFGGFLRKADGNSSNASGDARAELDEPSVNTASASAVIDKATKTDSSKKSTLPKNPKPKRQKRNSGRGRSNNKDLYIPPHLRPPKLDTPEAIAKWREERRKRWPSAKVVAAKRARLAELAKQEADANSSSCAAPSDPKHDASEEGHAKTPQDEHASSDQDPTTVRTCRFMLHDNKCRNGDECKFSHDVSGVELCDAYIKRGWCKWKKNCFRKHDKAARAAYQKEHGGGKNNQGQSGRKSSTRGGAVNKRSRPTLLQKLLHEEINHETSVLLNCLEHLVEENFWQSGEVAAENEPERSGAETT
eukprot:g366.t1